MSDRLIVDHGLDGRVSVSVWLDGALPDQPVGSVEFVSPLGEGVLEDLRWYLEDYLRAPYGVYGEKGPEIAAALDGWGASLFGSLFGAGAGREAYLRVQARSAAGTEIVLRSSVPGFLGLPWELLRDPSRPTALVLGSMGLARSLPLEFGDVFAVGGERLRVLMVISRPSAARDVGFRMVARPLLERLEAVRGRVELVVLRPPTLEAMRETLAQAAAEGQPFQVVHFDGHGALPGRRVAAGNGTALTLALPGEEGVLVFERLEGGPDDVSAGRVAQVLAAARVPLVVLNACQSGAVGKDLEAAVATRLLQEGVASVVAMAYSVYAVAAAEFMAVFYERLFAGGSVSEAVTAGRQRLAAHNKRPSPKGRLPLEDWAVPVHYLRREIRFSNLRIERSSDESLDELLDRVRDERAARDDELDPIGSFVGRDGLFYELESATRLQRVIILHGSGGTGKTELAKAFGRWWRDTGGVEQPAWAIFYSLEPGLASFGLDGIVAAVGLRIWGSDFMRLARVDRCKAVETVLAEQRLLLILDNFEAVFSMPDPTGATPVLDEGEREALRSFLHRIASAGRSAVIITSRSDEAWLGDLRRIGIGGLAADEAVEYADQILAPYPRAAPQRVKPGFADLLAWLDGHPLCMRLVLPHLDTETPEALLAQLQDAGKSDAADDEDRGRLASLSACISYSFDHLAEDSRRLLQSICLFHDIADAGVLALMSASPDAPERWKAIARDSWVNVLDQAAGVGLLTSLGGGIYRIHPALPSYLAARWRSDAAAAYENQRHAAAGALLDAHAELGWLLLGEIRQGDAARAFAIIDRQRRTLGSFLSLALARGEWEKAQPLAEALDAYLDARGLYTEARAWVDRARIALESPQGDPPSLDEPAGALWLFLVGAQGARELNGRHLDDAHQTYTDILDALNACPAPRSRVDR